MFIENSHQHADRVAAAPSPAVPPPAAGDRPLPPGELEIPASVQAASGRHGVGGPRPRTTDAPTQTPLPDHPPPIRTAGVCQPRISILRLVGLTKARSWAQAGRGASAGAHAGRLPDPVGAPTPEAPRRAPRNSATSRSMSSLVCANDTSHCSSSPGGVRMPRLTPQSQLSSAAPGRSACSRGSCARAYGRPGHRARTPKPTVLRGRSYSTMIASIAAIASSLMTSAVQRGLCAPRPPRPRPPSPAGCRCRCQCPPYGRRRSWP